MPASVPTPRCSPARGRSPLSLLPSAELRRLLTLATREGRRAEGSFLAEGLRSALWALDNRRPIRKLVICPDLCPAPRSAGLLALARMAGVAVHSLPRPGYLRVTGVNEPQGVLIETAMEFGRLSGVQPRPGSLWLGVGSIRFPGNLGTMVRTAEAFGAEGILLLERETDPYDPGAVRASMGAIFRQRLIRAAPEELIAWKLRHHCRVLGASPQGRTLSRDAAYGSGPRVLLLGCERRGLSPAEAAACDDTIRIPMSRRADSLNVAVAAGILLYDARLSG